jgi:hypothetical protein
VIQGTLKPLLEDNYGDMHRVGVGGWGFVLKAVCPRLPLDVLSSSCTWLGLVAVASLLCSFLPQARRKMDSVDVVLKGTYHESGPYRKLLKKERRADRGDHDAFTDFRRAGLC